MHHDKPSLLRCGNAVGLFLVLLFVLCFMRYALFPVQTELHEQLLQITYFGFTGMNTTSFILAMVQSYIYGYIGVSLWILVDCCVTECASCWHKK